MSKVLYACFKDTKPAEFSESNFKILSKRLQPDNIVYPDPEVVSTEKEILSIFNFNASVKVHDSSVCLGNIITENDSWWKPECEVPDGTYVIYRSNTEKVEVLTDMVGTRTVWFFHDENLFISSTSQRAIIFFLRSFYFNQQALSWMLATGTLGPGYSWDKRIKMLGVDSKLSLNRETWSFKIKSGNCDFKPVHRSKKEHYHLLNQSLIDSSGRMKLDFSKWILPLSGGYDSRAIFFLLKNKIELKCVTWGLESSLQEKGNDAFIAKEIAEKFEKRHKYYLTDFSTESVEKIFNRFLVCGEGRVCDIGGYMDGFRIWKELFEEGVYGIIRGDEGFGGNHVVSEVDVRHHMRFPFFSDFSNLKKLSDFGIPKQEFPAWLNRKEDESLEQWRDRMNHQYEIPVVFAALTDLKLAFVEVINPLLTRRVLSVVRTMPDKFRSNKRLFRKIVRKMDPDIKFAKKDATATPDNLLYDEKVINEFYSELNSIHTNEIFTSAFINCLLNNLKSNKNYRKSFNHRMIALIKKTMPSSLKNLLRSSGANVSLDHNMLVFRSYMISKMNRMLIDDSKACKSM